VEHRSDRQIRFPAVRPIRFGFGLWGYQHAHTPAFKLECAAYQEHIISMSFPDNMLCIMFWQIS